jgi:hypothetical protein
MTRSVVVRMRRRSPEERIEPWRMRINGPEAHELGDRLCRWANDYQHAVRWPEIPEGIEDRNADVWEALLAVADLAGGEWPERARCSAVTLVTASSDRGGSLGVILLRDLRAVFGDRDKLSTDTILEALHDIDESPWADLRGKPLDARGLARRLSKYGVRPKQMRMGDAIVRGYEAADLADPWSRYLPHPSPETDVTSVTPLQTRNAVTDVTASADNGGEPLCRACGYPMPPALAAAGETTHATCEEVPA